MRDSELRSMRPLEEISTAAVGTGGNNGHHDELRKDGGKDGALSDKAKRAIMRILAR